MAIPSWWPSSLKDLHPSFQSLSCANHHGCHPLGWVLHHYNNDQMKENQTQIWPQLPGRKQGSLIYTIIEKSINPKATFETSLKAGRYCSKPPEFHLLLGPIFWTGREIQTVLWKERRKTQLPQHKSLKRVGPPTSFHRFSFTLPPEKHCVLLGNFLNFSKPQFYASVK